MKKVVPIDAILIPPQAELVFKGVIYDVYQWQQTMFDNSHETFEMLKRADTAVSLAVVDDSLLILEDEQPHRGKRTSFPGGRVDLEDEDMESAARREVKEETGYSFRNWRLLKVSQPSTKIEWFVYVWLAWGIEDKAEPKLDAGEKIKVNTLNFNEVKDMVMKDQGHLGEARDIFSGLSSIEDLINLPEFKGKDY